MPYSRRDFLRTASNYGILASTSLLWSTPLSAAQLLAGTDYRAIVVVTLNGGNDGNNTVVPLEASSYAAYSQLRQGLALPKAQLLPLRQSNGAAPYGLHPSLVNIASLYNSNQAMLLANIGPIVRPSTKAQISGPAAYPGGSLSHPSALNESENGQVSGSGWGGRIADYLSSSSGSLPPVLTAVNSLFCVGTKVQAVAIQGGSAFAALPPALNAVISHMAQTDTKSANLLVQQAALLKIRAASCQLILDKAKAYDQLKTSFGSSRLQSGLGTIAQLIAGRSVVGASRQIFYVEQGGYDTHGSQLTAQAAALADLDQGIGNFMQALDEIGMRDKVIICTHSDFSRSLQPNTSAGSDHGWGNHHFLIGSALAGGRMIGQMPDMELNGALDLTGTGVWIPTQSMVQMTAALASWLGLTQQQVSSVFPDLQNFPTGAISLS